VLLLNVQEFRPITVEELEGTKRKDIEAALIKHDIKKQRLNEEHAGVA
jgi:pre-mRNA-splicing factor CDC5/CEF1